VKYMQPFGISDPNAPYINGNPATGEMGSIPPAASIEHDMREIVEVINYAYEHKYRDSEGTLCQAPSEFDLQQLRKAIWGFINSDKMALNLTYYVNSGNGSDTANDGLTLSTAFASIQRAINESQKYDPNGYVITIYVADGTYSAFVAGSGSLKGWGYVRIIGNNTTPAACMITTTGAVACHFTGKSRTYLFGGFKIVNNGVLPVYGHGVLATDDVFLNVYNLDLGHCGGNQMWSSRSTLHLCGMIDQVPNVTMPFIRVTGGTPASHMSSSESGSLSSHCPDLQIMTAMTVGSWNSSSYASHSIFVGDPFGSQPNFYNSITGKANVTGQKFQVQGNSIIQAGGDINYFPGTTAGAVYSGGQYI
jgi:hypothetical protein